METLLLVKVCAFSASLQVRVAEGKGDVVDRETTTYTGMNEPPGRWTP